MQLRFLRAKTMSYLLFDKSGGDAQFHGRDAFRGHGPLLQVFVQVKFLFVKQRVIYCLMRD
ncbi:hypothetical protein D9M69_463400 [compost metagenome]